MSMTLAVRSSSLLLSLRVRALHQRSASLFAVELAYNKYDRETSPSAKHSPLVILHGLFGHKQNWHSVAKALNKRLGTTVFAVDLRNHGDSPWTETMSYSEMAADVTRFLKEVVLQESSGEMGKAHLLGHSMGGKTAIKIALSPEGPKLLESLMVEDMVPKKYETSSHRRFPEYLRAMKRADLSQTRHEINAQLSSAIPDLVTRQFLLTNLTGNNGSLRWRLNLDAIEKYLYDMCDVENPDGCFNSKSLFISGRDSPYVTPDDHPLILKLFPRTKFSVIDGAGHWVHAEKPYEFIDEISKFIKEC